MICGAPGSGTSIVTRILRYSGMFAGADAGPIDVRKFHESKSFRDANNQILSATINFPHAPKSATQFLTHVHTLENNLDDLIQLIDVEHLLSQYWANEGRFGLWGWKDPRNSANVLVWRTIFSGLRLLIIETKWRWSNRKRLGTDAGNWFRMESNSQIRRLYCHPPHIEGLDTLRLSLDRLLTGASEFNKLWNWLGLEEQSFPNYRELASLIGETRSNE